MSPLSLAWIPRRVPLLCLPYAGGDSRSYKSWQGLLPAAVDAQTVHLPGRETRLAESLPTSLVVEAALVAQEIGPLLNGRFVVFGHSMGALLAFEFVRALRRDFNLEPSCLIVSGYPAPDRLDGVKRYSHLDNDALRAEVEGMGGTDPTILHDPKLWAVMVPILRADMRMCDEYCYAPDKPLSCPMVAYGSHDDPGLDPAWLARWSRHTTGPFESEVFPGDHFYFQRLPEAFAIDMTKRLRRHVLDQIRDEP